MTEARTRLKQARLYLQVAEAVLGNESDDQATVATGNAVLAAIAGADAITCALAGFRHRRSDHRHAADVLDEVTGDRRVSALLRAVLDLKDAAHYGLRHVQVSRARAAIRKAQALLAVAEEHADLH